MAKRILIPVDESTQSQRALTYALEEYPEAAITILHVIDPREFRTYGGIEGWVDLDQIGEQRRAHAKRLVKNAQQQAADQGRTVETGVVIGKASPTIIEYATDNDIDHIVMGSHRRSGINRLLFGSVAEKAIRKSPIPVTIVE
jgi:nucleotide-binding universal stress UspA family protein